MTSTQFFCAGTETESLWRFVWPKLICFCTGRKQCWQHKRSFWPNSAHPKDYFGSHWPESYAQMAGKHVVNCIKDVEHQVQTASKVVLHANNFARQTFFKRSGFIILIQLWVQLSFCAAARKNCKNVDTICRTLFGSHVGAPQSACWSWHEWTRATTDLAFFHSYRRASSGYMGMESVTIMKLQNVF